MSFDLTLPYRILRNKSKLLFIYFFFANRLDMLFYRRSCNIIGTYINFIVRYKQKITKYFDLFLENHFFLSNNFCDGDLIALKQKDIN